MASNNTNVCVRLSDIEQLAKNIEKKNNDLETAFSELKKVIKSAMDSWSSSSAQGVDELFNGSVSNSISNEVNAVKDRTEFLNQNISTGYLLVENKNVELGNQFMK